MIRHLPLLALLALSGCGSDATVDYTDTEQAARIESLEARVFQLQQDLREQDAEISQLQTQNLEDAQALTSLRDVVNGNARVGNQNAVNDMTRRGACGYEPGPPGSGIISQPKQCTEEDLR